MNDSAMGLNNTQRKQCCVSTAKMVTRTRHNVIRALPALFFFLRADPRRPKRTLRVVMATTGTHK